jgi:hypothetical protein
MTKQSWTSAVLAVFLGLSLFGPLPRAAEASDHADPMVLKEPDANITGLFFFPHGDQMIVIFNVRRALRAPKPYNLSPYSYVVHMDLHPEVSFASEEDRLRYGGTLLQPEGLQSEVTLTFQLNDDTTLKSKKFEGLANPESIRVFTGVRDDPFIFPRFFQKNVISMALSIPMSSFPPGQQDWALWGSVYRDGQQIDHVGRSSRTQLGRFDALNTLPPTGHVQEIRKLLKETTGLFNFLNKYTQTAQFAGLIQYVKQVRKYDLVADVMLYSNRFPPGYPNGRQLPDDIVGLTCAQGDCVLQEIAFIEGAWPRQTVNDKPFLPDFPFLAEPGPDQPATAPAMKSVWPLAILVLVVNLLIGWAVVSLVLALFRKLRRR